MAPAMDGMSRTQSVNSEQSVGSIYNEAVQFHKAGMVVEAESKFRQALSRNKRHVPTMVGLGAMLREQGRHEEGTKFLQEASGIVAAPAAETSMSMRAANNGAARPFTRASSLTSYAFHRASSAEKITSIKDAGNLVRKNLKVLKMAKLFSGGVDGGGGLAAALAKGGGSEPAKAAGAKPAFAGSALLAAAKSGGVKTGSQESMFERTRSAPDQIESPASSCLNLEAMAAVAEKHSAASSSKAATPDGHPATEDLCIDSEAALKILENNQRQITLGKVYKIAHYGVVVAEANAALLGQALLRIGMFGNVPPACVAAEFLGTLLFQFFGGAASANSHAHGLATAALGNGLCLAVLVYSTAGISGGHLNPAVSAGFLSTGRLGMRRFVLYTAAQVLGACVGGVLLRVCLPAAYLKTPFTTTGELTDAHPVQTFLLEFTATLILVYTVFATAVDRCGAAKNAAPLTIGLAVAVGIFAVGPFTGGAINPARTIGAATAFWEMGNSPVYVAATLAGGVAAAKVYDTLYLWDVQPATPEERDE